MTQETRRDGVWSRALFKALEGQEFGTKDIERTFEKPPTPPTAPSRRTIRDVLITMEHAGWLERNREGGHYWRAGGLLVDGLANHETFPVVSVDDGESG